MATPSLPQSRFGSSLRTPTTPQTMPQSALRWVDAQVAKASPSPVKKWPPVKTNNAAPAPTPVAAPKPLPTTEKTKHVSLGFQSARAVFEAKKSMASSPPTPPGPRRLAFPSPAKPFAVKNERARVLSMSSSSCTTVDSETDRELHASETRREPKKSWPPHQTAAVEKPSPVENIVAKIESPFLTESVAPVVTTTQRQPVATKPVAGHAQTKFDPFLLLEPIEVVPTLPDEVACVYDVAATDMQKGIKKVVRKLLKKDKTRLEEFKMNARLFGTDFMDAHAYLDTLIKDFGAIRALQLVPCLLSIQPDIVKSNALLLTAKNYALRNEEALERECQSLRAFSPTKVASTVEGSTPIDSAAVTSTPPPLRISTRAKSPPTTPEVSAVPIIPANTASPVMEAPVESASTGVKSTGNLRKIFNVVKQSGSRFSPAPKAATTPVVAFASEHSSRASVVKNEVEAINEPTRMNEPVPEPQESTFTKVKTAMADEALAPLPPVKIISPSPALKARVESFTQSDSEEDNFRAENLFGEPIKRAPSKRQGKTILKQVSAPVSPASSAHSFDDAEGLFGERLSVSSLPSERPRKAVTWGESETMKPKPVRKAPPAPFIFGLATAGALDSDSDDE